MNPTSRANFLPEQRFLPLRPALQEHLAKGIAEEAAGRSTSELEARPDHFLVDPLALKPGQE